MISFTPLWLDPSPGSNPPSPDQSTITPSCAKNSDLCHFIYEQTDRVWLAESSYWVVVKPLRIIAIIALALLIRFIIHRAINRIIDHTVDSSSALFTPIRERLSPTVRTASALPSERGRQRAKALGSVLRNIASTVLFAVGTMLILDELNVNLGPILASAGIAGIAIGFGAQNLVKDFVAGIFILLEDQFGVGDIVDLTQLTSSVSGTVEAVGLRITTVRDEYGEQWYIRNGEIIKVGNKSQGWSLVVIDIHVDFAYVTKAMASLHETVSQFAKDPEWADRLITPPEVLGVEEITSEATIVRTVAKTSLDSQAQLGRELRQRITEALHDAGLDTPDSNETASDPSTELTPQKRENGSKATIIIQQTKTPTSESPKSDNRPDTKDGPR